MLNGEGMALGVLPRIQVAKNSVHVGKGDALIFYTDGVTEAMNEDYDEFGLERLHHTVRTHKHEDAANIVGTITAAIADHTGNTPQSDDMTLVVMKNV
jgi:sigma-B regulation protein RsbU (phosphoserine phosphatase)